MKTNTSTITKVLLAFIVLLSSCSIHKRTYRDGYQVEWHLRQQSLPEKKIASPALSHGSMASTDTKQAVEIANQLTIETNKEKQQHHLSTPPKKHKVHKRQKKHFAKHRSLGKKSSFSKGGIKHINKPINKKDEPKPEKTSQTIKKIIHPYAIWSLISALLGIFVIPVIGSIASIILANIALDKIKENPEKYRGRTMAQISKGLSLLVIGLAIIFSIIVVIILLALFL